MPIWRDTTKDKPGTVSYMEAQLPECFKHDMAEGVQEEVAMARLAKFLSHGEAAPDPDLVGVMYDLYMEMYRHMRSTKAS